MSLSVCSVAQPAANVCHSVVITIGAEAERVEIAGTRVGLSHRRLKRGRPKLPGQADRLERRQGALRDKRQRAQCLRGSQESHNVGRAGSGKDSSSIARAHEHASMTSVVAARGRDAS